MRKKLLTSNLIPYFTVGLLALTPSLFAADQSFYEGKTIRFIIASGPGGGTDTAGWLVARFLPNPTVAVGP